jgi:hypothetical protein
VRERPTIAAYVFKYAASSLGSVGKLSTNSVNNNLIELGDDGAKLITTSIQKVVKDVARFSDRLDNHIDVIPKFMPRNTNLKYWISSVIESIDQGGLDLSRKLKPEASPPTTPARERVPKRKNSSPLLGQKISPRLVFSIAKKVSKQTSCSLWICRRSIAASFVSTIKDAPNPIRLANLSMLEGGRRFLLEIRNKLLCTAML